LRLDLRNVRKDCAEGVDPANRLSRLTSPLPKLLPGLDKLLDAARARNPVVHHAASRVRGVSCIQDIGMQAHDRGPPARRGMYVPNAHEPRRAHGRSGGLSLQIRSQN
jgi:hypothetical protein